MKKSFKLLTLILVVALSMVVLTACGGSTSAKTIKTYVAALNLPTQEQANKCFVKPADAETIKINAETITKIGKGVLTVAKTKETSADAKKQVIVVSFVITLPLEKDDKTAKTIEYDKTMTFELVGTNWLISAIV